MLTTVDEKSSAYGCWNKQTTITTTTKNGGMSKTLVAANIKKDLKCTKPKITNCVCVCACVCVYVPNYLLEGDKHNKNITSKQ